MSVHSTLLGAGLQLVDGSDTESQDDQIQTSARRLQGRGIAAQRTTARSSFRPAIKSMAPKDRQPTITYSISMASFDVVDRFVLLQGFSRTRRACNLIRAHRPRQSSTRTGEMRRRL
ncbi:hypothetical protein C8034_v003597 [Colletotrichum sidae]|uniref:Uncharacterized protein n=1 Tax=Colletotrichum sidae TaxID=1347389 RepID=A0A4R8TSG4_9PEZI|nr:hypothetical protein C8034_v003597 [Colletotrichum sidae]